MGAISGGRVFAGHLFWGNLTCFLDVAVDQYNIDIDVDIDNMLAGNPSVSM